MTAQRELSTTIGTRAISGSEPSALRNVVMAFSESSMASSMFTSIICAPPSTCCRAMASAGSYSPRRISSANRGEPVTLVRSPMFTKFVSGRMTSASRPLNRAYGSGFAGTRGATPCKAAPIAQMCAGVDPQHPPAIFSQPLRAKSPTSAAIRSGVSSNPPNALRSPALG